MPWEQVWLSPGAFPSHAPWMVLPWSSLGPIARSAGAGLSPAPTLMGLALLVSRSSIAHGAFSSVLVPDQQVVWAVLGPCLGSLGALQVTPTHARALLLSVLHFSCWLCPLSIPCVTEEQCSRSHLALGKTQPTCLAKFNCGGRPWQEQDVAAHVSVPPEPNPSVRPFAQARTWVLGGDRADGLQGSLLAVSCQC